MLKLFAFITLCCINYCILNAFNAATDDFVKIENPPLYKVVAYTIIFILLLVSLGVMITLTIAYCISVIF